MITVGAINLMSTLSRSDDVVANFSSRGPTRGAMLSPTGTKSLDNQIKPDLVAPGNRIVAALAEDTVGAGGACNVLASRYSALAQVAGASQGQDQALMMLSGTSVAAPVVAGAVALMPEVNHGLAPPMVRAILQYTAQALPNASLAQQGAGTLNVEGAVRLAAALRNDMTARLQGGGSIAAGESLFWSSGQALPNPVSTINGQTIPWSRVAVVGGNPLSRSACCTRCATAACRCTTGAWNSTKTRRCNTGAVGAAAWRRGSVGGRPMPEQRTWVKPVWWTCGDTRLAIHRSSAGRREKTFFHSQNPPRAQSA